ncbi:TIGR02594 family protein [Aquimarina sp. MMG016]|uniref:TIGR02594 family protein n=1 Tax=Aquimarina sp. MMG016 TaxID=2822690 RepID=UPI001B39FDF9|nr:TIGR02594 family protein [Aquimarina sp. MMG016]MBQ4822424.1 TIGR02594 family protein [Aquimarina sp. MMG016]
MAGEFVINGATLKCPLCSSSGKLMVSHAQVQMQDTQWATDADKGKANLVFGGVCKKWRKSPPPCASVIAPTKWKRTADSVAVDGRLALLSGSTIKCATGGVPISITNTAQIDIPTDLPDIEENEEEVLEENTPPWMPIAKGEMGVEEVIGDSHNPRVIEYHDAAGYNSSLMGREISDDKRDPWCGSFVYWCLKQSGIPENLLSNTGYRAYSWESWGKGVSEPGYGAIVVLNYSHVGFVAGKKGNSLVVLGGNQKGGDNTTNGKVCYTIADPANVKAYRYPSDYEVTENHYELEEIDTNADADDYDSSHS